MFTYTVETARLLWNPLIHHRVYKALPLNYNVTQINPVHIFTSKIHFMICLGLQGFPTTMYLPSIPCVLMPRLPRLSFGHTNIKNI